MARTRKDVRLTQLIEMREDQLSQLLSAYDAKINTIEQNYLRLIAQHIKEIGNMTASDVQRLEQMKRMNRNITRIEQEIAQYLPNGMEDLNDAMDAIAETDTRIAAIRFGKSFKSVSENIALTKMLNAVHKETAKAMKNLSNTTVVNTAYKEAVDQAVWAVRSGMEDYGKAIRSSLRRAGSFGLRTREEDSATVVDYESGYSRRLDSAVRQNILDGVRHTNQSIIQQTGEKFGADGVEIDAHMLCADDHLPYQGRQFSNAEFEKIQDGLERPFGEWNCRHTWSPILLGISKPRYTDDQLREMKTYSTEKVTYDGKTMTRYEWSQQMRRIETAVRQQKDAQYLAQAEGDDTLQSKCRQNIAALQEKYKGICEATGLETQYERMRGTGNGSGKNAESLLTAGGESGIINEHQERKFTPLEPNAIYGHQHIDEIQALKTSEEIKEYFSYTDDDYDKVSYFEQSFFDGFKDVNRQREFAEGVEMARRDFGLKSLPIIRAEKSKAHAGSCGGGIVHFSTDCKLNQEFATAIHEMVHYSDGCQIDTINKIIRDTLKNHGIRKGTNKEYNILYGIAGIDYKDPREVLAWAVERHYTNRSDIYADEITSCWLELRRNDT